MLERKQDSLHEVDLRSTLKNKTFNDEAREEFLNEYIDMKIRYITGRSLFKGLNQQQQRGNND